MSTPFLPLKRKNFFAEAPWNPKTIKACVATSRRAGARGRGGLRSLTARAWRVHNPPSLTGDDKDEAHLSAQQPPPQEDPRLPGADEHEERTARFEAQAGQRS